jgi:prepilin-type N-terminal cleavage/methylation domain-containing protein
MIKKNKGYSLIELLVAITVLVIIITTTFVFLSTSISGSGKTEINKIVKQNASYALSIIEKIIIPAREISCTANSINVEDLDGGTTVFSFDNERISSGSSFLTDESVSVILNSLSCSTSPGIPATVNLDFTVRQKLTNTPRAGETSSQRFSSTIIMKNFLND